MHRHRCKRQHKNTFKLELKLIRIEIELNRGIGKRELRISIHIQMNEMACSLSRVSFSCFLDVHLNFVHLFATVFSFYCSIAWMSVLWREKKRIVFVVYYATQNGWQQTAVEEVTTIVTSSLGRWISMRMSVINENKYFFTLILDYLFIFHKNRKTKTQNQVKKRTRKMLMNTFSSHATVLSSDQRNEHRKH